MSGDRFDLSKGKELKDGFLRSRVLDIECTFVLYDLISRLFLGSNACVLGLTDILGQLSF